MSQTAQTLYTYSSPPVHPITAEQFQGQRIKRIISLVTITNGDAIGSTYFLGCLPDNAVVTNIQFDGPECSGAEGTVGLYDMNAVVKSAACYSGTINFTTTGATSKFGGSNYAYSAMTAVVISATASLNTSQQPVWQVAGDTQGPAPATAGTLPIAQYQLGLVLTAAATATETYLCAVEYICAE